MLYLLGAALLYGAYGTLDIALLAGASRPSRPPGGRRADDRRAARQDRAVPAASVAAAGPCRRAAGGQRRALGAGGQGRLLPDPAAVVRRLRRRCWPRRAAQLLAALGAAAILFGSVLALRQARLKLLIAYSTVAQIGYLFLMFPLVAGAATPRLGAVAWTGGVLQPISHAFAKAAMFMAAGLIAEALGHDRIAELGGVGRALPMSVFAFGLAGLSLMGLPPSGGFVAKWLLLTAGRSTTANGGGRWSSSAAACWPAATSSACSAPALAPPAAAVAARAPSRAARGGRAGARACSVLLGLVPLRPFDLLQIGRHGAGRDRAP